MNERIEKALVKFLMNAANIDDLDILTDWLKKDKHKQIFKSYVKTNYAMDMNMNVFDSEKAKKEYLSKIKKDKSDYKLKRIRNITKYAAASIIVGIVATTYFFRNNIFPKATDSTPTIVNTNIIESGSDKATLTLGNGSLIVLEKGKSLQTQNANSNGEEIIYKTNQSNRKTKEVTYNYLTIPRGGQFYIELSDGTQVWLNSESQLKYPVNFIEGETRKVELVYGEAYFDVSPSTEHKGSKFKVINNAQDVEVIGTEFNIKAYKDEAKVYTTLVEGKIDVSFKNEKQRLIPNQQLNLDLSTNTSTIKKVDVYNEISWKEGLFVFKKKPLKEIMRILSRWYDVDFVFENKTAEAKRFNGVLKKNVKISEVLDIVKGFGIIKNYKINGKTIVLK